uniref:Ig-like domain-containing protein n=1 Tax=Neolamprologus brichardi TaxID=32507 RepID=A0A3Q4H8W1_NEOBR
MFGEIHKFLLSFLLCPPAEEHPVSVDSASVRTGFIGDEVLLPCICSNQLSEPVTAFWRDKDDKVVLDIINSREDKIDAKFTGRVFSFPDYYKNGNLSILIKDLRADDAGPYECDIPKDVLLVAEKIIIYVFLVCFFHTVSSY